MRLSRRQTWAATPLPMRICFFGGVFSLCASIGALASLTGTAYVPPMQIALNVLIVGGFAIVYAAASLWQRYWIIPIAAVIEGFFFEILGAHYHSSTQLFAENSPLHKQLRLLAVIAIISVVLGYTLFITFFATQGARYFRAHNEIAMAGEIHRALVPPIHKTLPNFEIFGISIPSGEVGGDLVDIAEEGQSWTGYVADVSGHGVSAGLLMAMFKTAVRTRAKDLSSGELLAAVHRALYPLKTPNMFATVGVLQWTGQAFSLTLAGHLPLLHYQKSSVEVREYPSPDLPLGVLPEQTFASIPVICQTGDILVLLTDGFTEVFDKKGQEMGIDAVKQVLARSANQALPELSASIRQAALNFGKQTDDQTILMVRCT